LQNKSSVTEIGLVYICCRIQQIKELALQCPHNLFFSFKNLKDIIPLLSTEKRDNGNMNIIMG